MRNLLHTLVSILMWILFGYYWYVVGRRQIDVASFEAMGVLALLTVLGVLATLWWIAHNKKLASRNRRLAAPDAPLAEPETDYLDRPLAGDPLAALKTAGTVVIRLDEDGAKVRTAATGRGD